MKKKSKKIVRNSKRHRTNECTNGAGTSSQTEKSYSENDSDRPIGSDDEQNNASSEHTERVPIASTPNLERECWTNTTNQEEKSREEEFDDYLADLLL